MTSTAIKTSPPQTQAKVVTSREQLDDLLVRLEERAEVLLQDEVWDEETIEFVATLREVFAAHIGGSDRMLQSYLADCGMCVYTEEEIAEGVPFKADEWTPEVQPDGFEHDYLDNFQDEDAKRWLPEDWVTIPRYIFGGPVEPATKDILFDLLEWVAINDCTDVGWCPALAPEVRATTPACVRLSVRRLPAPFFCCVLLGMTYVNYS